MKLLRGFQQVPACHAGTVATIGNFDGVHRGHQALLHALREQANRLHLPLLVILFEPQPGEFFHTLQAPARLSSLREKIQALEACGVDYIFCIKFNSYLASMTASEFATRYIFSMANTKYLLIGEDFHFGRERLGDAALLRELGQEQSCEVQLFSDFYIDEERVSSTKIRQALHRGDLLHAATLLGRTYAMCGRVVRGDGRGRQWGVPTANLILHRTAMPLKGVFCVRVKRRGKPWLQGVANVGYRPTVDGSRCILETHLFDFDESLYGELLQIHFMHKLRDEIKFSSVEALISQIHQDIGAAKAYFSPSGLKNTYDYTEE